VLLTVKVRDGCIQQDLMVFSAFSGMEYRIIAFPL